MAISAQLRQQVLLRAQRCCEYCQTQQRIVIWMEIDHIIPTSQGGGDILDNLCLSCAICNRHKSDATTGFDPDTQQEVLLYNPRLQVWQEHFQWDDSLCHVQGLSQTGRATIHRLNMNDEDVVLARQEWVKVGWHPPKDV